MTIENHFSERLNVPISAKFTKREVSRLDLLVKYYAEENTKVSRSALVHAIVVEHLDNMEHLFEEAEKGDL